MTTKIQPNKTDVSTSEEPKTNIYFWLLFTVITLISFAIRCYSIESRPLHSDEGVNYHFLQDINKTGIYPYSHENYHGPVYFWTTKWTTDLVGMSPFGLRLSSILAGVLLPLTLLSLRRKLGDSFVLLASAFIALSPSLVFYSRYAIHEMLFLLCCTWFAVDFYLMCFLQRKERIYSSATALALIITIKETFVLTLAALFISSLLIFTLTWDKRSLYKAFIVQHLRELSRASLLAITIVFLFFSSWMRSFDGIREFVGAIPQWTGRGTVSDVGHFKPYYYYLRDVFWPTEPYLLIAYGALALLPVLLTIHFAWSRSLKVQDSLLLPLYFSVWAAVIGIAYSAVPYKTPWLAINLTVPTLLALASWLAMLWRTKGSGLVVIAIFLTIITVMVRKTIYYNYQSKGLLASAVQTTLPYGPGNPFSYTHTSPGMLALVDDMKDYWAKRPQAKVLIGVTTYWPLPYYFRGKEAQTGYLIPNDIDQYTMEYDVIIVSNTSSWHKEGWARKYYRLSDVQEAFVFFKPLPIEQYRPYSK